MSLTYSSYLELDRLLDLQHPASDPPEHDEMLFIIIHQVYELWFKLLLHEFDKASADLTRGALFEAIATFKRIRMVMKTLVAQLDVLETLSPLSFNSFRHRLETASGFQSPQFRELEFLLGHKRPEMLRYHQGNVPALARLEARLQGPSIVDALYDFLRGFGFTPPPELQAKDVRAPTAPHPAVQASLLTLYATRADVRILLEIMTDVDEGLQEWRYRHVKMVERTIGDKPGTGGSQGVTFLRQTLFQPVFPDLWAIRGQV
ncbi:MAG: tryptophan 2,3-dioxygenase family protein [Gemmatimonadota bacterium]